MYLRYKAGYSDNGKLEENIATGVTRVECVDPSDSGKNEIVELMDSEGGTMLMETANIRLIADDSFFPNGIEDLVDSIQVCRPDVEDPVPDEDTFPEAEPKLWDPDVECPEECISQMLLTFGTRETIEWLTHTAYHYLNLFDKNRLINDLYRAAWYINRANDLKGTSVGIIEADFSRKIKLIRSLVVAKMESAQVPKEAMEENK